MKKKVTFEVDGTLLFDTLRKMDGDTAPLGARIVSCLLMEPGFADAIGMGVYGVVYLGSEKVDEEPRS